MDINKGSVMLLVCATDKCNRGCTHCSVCATTKGERFVKPMWIKKLVREAKELGLTIYGSVSGLGEPLMHPKIHHVVRAFTGLKICRKINITTSGFLSVDTNEAKRFNKILNSPAFPIIHFNFSFNLYGKKFSERLENTLGALFRYRRMSYSDIRIVADRKNYWHTFVELHEVLSCMQVKLGMNIIPVTCDYTDECYEKIIGSFFEMEYSEEKEMQLAADSLYMPYIYKIESKKYGIRYFRMDPSMTSKLGFAEKMPDSCFMNGKYVCKNLTDESDSKNHLYMDPSGVIYPGCDCITSGLNIGTWETPLKELLRRKAVIREKMAKLVLSDINMPWGDYPCDACAQLIKRNIIFP